MPLDFNPFAAEDSDTPDRDPDGNGKDDRLEARRLPELQDMCQTLGINSDGSRTVLIKRIRAHQRTADQLPAV